MQFLCYCCFIQSEFGNLVGVLVKNDLLIIVLILNSSKRVDFCLQQEFGLKQIFKQTNLKLFKFNK